MSSKYQYELPKHTIQYGITVKVSDLKTDPQAQRVLVERRAQAIANNLIVEAIGVIVVSQRADGTKWIIDGQHRVRALQLAGHKTVVAEIHIGLTLKDEAVLFMLSNNESQRVSAIDLFNVGLTAGADLQVDVQNVLDKHDLKVGIAPSTNVVAAVRCLEDVTRRHGADVLHRALSVAEEAWGRDARSWEGTLLGGLGEFLGKHGEDVDDKTLVAKIQRHGNQNKWLMTSTGMMLTPDGGGAAVSKRHGCYRALKAEWNKNRPAAKRLV
jgi:hypothetical protein